MVFSLLSKSVTKREVIQGQLDQLINFVKPHAYQRLSQYQSSYLEDRAPYMRWVLNLLNFIWITPNFALSQATILNW